MFCYDPNLSQNLSVVQPLSSTNNLGGLNSPSLNNTADYKDTTSAESAQYQYFEDSLTCCCLFDLLPEQAVKEFRDEYEITPGKVREWLEKCGRLDWSERLGGAA